MSKPKKNKKHRSPHAEFMIVNLGGGPLRDRRKRRIKAKKHDYRNPLNW